MNRFRPGEVWLDTDGVPIQAHGGGILYHEGTYYWYGENKDADTIEDGLCGYRVEARGFSCYSSTNLYDWRHAGIVLPSERDDERHDLHPTKVVERPKVIYNDKTKQFVMWFHVDDKDYAYARTGVATSSHPAGPFVYRGSFRPQGEESRDMTLFQDEDGTAYLIYSSEKNSTLHIARLTEDYLETAGPVVRLFPDKYREAPAVFKHDGKYWMISSWCTGWDPNEAEYAVSDKMLGDWTACGNPCVGDGAEVTFGAQSTFVLPVRGQEQAYIFMADRWVKEDLRDSRYVWLPIEFEGSRMKIKWAEEWTLG